MPSPLRCDVALLVSSKKCRQAACNTVCLLDEVLTCIAAATGGDTVFKARFARFELTILNGEAKLVAMAREE